jgi:dihydrofolate reductase
MVTLYNVVSADGFIARKDGNEDFIPDELWPVTLSLMREYEVLVMGRRTYEALQEYEEALLKPFEEMSIKKIVVSRDEDFQQKEGYVKISNPSGMSRHGSNILVCSGPTLNNYLLHENLVDAVIHHKLGVEVGDGIKVFDDTYRSTLSLVSETGDGLATKLVYKTVTPQ